MMTILPKDNVRAAPTLAAMFEARKQVFIDLLGWDLPVLADRFEIDSYDDEQARYLIIADADHRHLGSVRLLATDRPHILGDLFTQLCEGEPPRGDDIFEITRFCLGRGLGAGRRRDVRDMLVTALTRYALDHGIRAYTGVAEAGWLQQILAFGWRCRPLGLPQRIGGRMLGALRIDIDEETPGLLAAAGIHASAHAREAA